MSISFIIFLMRIHLIAVDEFEEEVIAFGKIRSIMQKDIKVFYRYLVS